MDGDIHKIFKWIFAENDLSIGMSTQACRLSASINEKAIVYFFSSQGGGIGGNTQHKYNEGVSHKASWNFQIVLLENLLFSLRHFIRVTIDIYNILAMTPVHILIYLVVLRMTTDNLSFRHSARAELSNRWSRERTKFYPSLAQ